MKHQYKFSLVLCTIGNHIEIKQFINSLTSYPPGFFELIVIDQNQDSITDYFNVLRSLKHEVKYYHVNFKGLSRARNFGLKYVTGQIVAFPDDDCIYSELLLYNVEKLFSPQIAFLTVNTCDINSPSKALVNLPDKQHLISFKNKSAVSFTLFLKSKYTSVIGDFDINMGVGAGTKYGAGEESDYIVRALSMKLNGVYFPHLFVYHPAKESVNLFSDDLKKRMISYGGGYGYFIRKNFIRQGCILSIKLIIGVFYRLLKSLKSPTQYQISKSFLIGFINGLLKR